MSRCEVIGDAARGEAYAAVRLVVEDGRIVEADAPGLARPLRGLTLLEAAAVPGDELAADALADAIGPLVAARPDRRRVAVAMSGGVDSAVALLRAAPHAVGVTLRLWVDPAGPRGERVCCSPAAVIAARQTCHGLGLPHVTLDLRDTFRRAVVQPFVADYADGLTPNPCTRCNGAFRFRELVAFSERVGAAALWTGHYARLVERDGLRLVARAADAEKDQSYMLATVPPELLRRVGFPLGDQTKADTRAEAERAGLSAARRRESQEACFLGGGDYRVFLRRHGLEDRPGPIVDEEGAVVGRHRGIWDVTPGQRRRLELERPPAEPRYALRTDPGTATVVVGPRRSLACGGLSARGRLHVPVTRAAVKVRHRAPAVSATVAASTDGFEVRFDDPVDAVAAGQVAALYDDGGAVVGSGVIAATQPAA